MSATSIEPAITRAGLPEHFAPHLLDVPGECSTTTSRSLALLLLYGEEHVNLALICRVVCQVGVFGRVRVAGGFGVVGRTGRRARCRRCQSDDAGIGTPGPGFVLPACAV